MKKRLPPLNWLRSFEASARHLNFTQAAAELNMTQAAISQQIKGLESQLGVTLFKRLPRGLELTESGMAYQAIVHEAITRLTVATDELFGRGRDQLLTVRSSLVFFTHWLAPRIGNFRERYPGIGLRFTSNIWADEREKDADLEIRYGHGSWRGFHSDQLSWDELIPVCSPTLKNNQPLPQKPEDLANYPLLHVLGYEEGWGHWFNSTGNSQLDYDRSMQMDTLITALEMAAQGQGIALGRTALVADLIKSGRLVAPLAEKIPASEAFYLMTPDNQHKHPHSETFRQWIIEEAERARQETIV